jgi:hypothetical protein
MQRGILQPDQTVVKYLEDKLDKRLNVAKHLKVADLHFLYGKSTTQIAKEENLTSSRVSDMLQLYRSKIVPLLIEKLTH